MNKTELIHMVSDMGVAQPEEAVEGVLEAITRSLAADEEVSLRGFGRFTIRHLGATAKPNPLTRVVHHSPARLSVGFVPSGLLRARLVPGS